MNHAEATRTLLKYLRDCGREKTAFFALNPNSAADLTKQDVFAAWSRRFPVAAGPNVFWNRGSLKECYESFFSHVCRFDSVICANDIAAAALLEQLKKDGVTVPKELYLLSYGDSSLARAPVGHYQRVAEPRRAGAAGGEPVRLLSRQGANGQCGGAGTLPP